jgi:hypothetical protein
MAEAFSPCFSIDNMDTYETKMVRSTEPTKILFYFWPDLDFQRNDAETLTYTVPTALKQSLCYSFAES